MINLIREYSLLLLPGPDLSLLPTKAPRLMRPGLNQSLRPITPPRLQHHLCRTDVKIVILRHKTSRTSTSIQSTSRAISNPKKTAHLLRTHTTRGLISTPRVARLSTRIHSRCLTPKTIRTTTAVQKTSALRVELHTEKSNGLQKSGQRFRSTMFANTSIQTITSSSTRR